MHRKGPICMCPTDAGMPCKGIFIKETKGQSKELGGKKMKRKKWIALFLSFIMCFSMMLSACGQSQETTAESGATEAVSAEGTSTSENEDEANAENTPQSDVTLELAVTWTDEVLAMFQEVVDEYTAETGVQFDIVAPGQEYESQLKVRMANNDLPDMWMTHGWSVIRYSEYLMDLSNESWASDVSDAARGVIEDENGSIYVLPVSIVLSSICFNKDVLEQSGVDWTQINTMDDFEAACEKIRDAGFAPVIISGMDTGSAGSVLNPLLFMQFATPTSPAHDQLQAHLDGTVDIAQQWAPCFQRMLDWRDNNFYNADYLTQDQPSGHKMLGAGTGAFYFRNTANIASALSYYPDANLGLLPFPSLTEDGGASMCISEGTTLGIWKDTEYAEECKAFLNWLAQPDVASRFFEFDGGTAGLNSTPDDSLIATLHDEVIEAYGEDIYYDNIFDRKYLPNGVWNSMCEATAMLLNDTPVEEVGEYMQEGFTTCYEEAQLEE